MMELPKFRHPFTSIVAGATGSGKSYFVRNILKYRDDLFINLPKNSKIIWCYGIYSPLYNVRIDNCPITYHDGLLTESQVKNEKPDIIIVDDLMFKVNDQTLCDLFVRGSHHLNFSIIFVTQNIFAKGKFMREISLNSHYFFFLKSIRDISQIQKFGQQLYPGKSRFFLEAYSHSTKDRFGYLVVDLHPLCDDQLRVRSNIFPVNGIISPTIYIPK